MLKGCQKQLVMLKPGENSVFESAWFVLREEKHHVAYDDMIAEANRIASGGVVCRGHGYRRGRTLFLGMLLGTLFGGGVMALLLLLI